jgi:predicted transposase YbfD/YdcC
MDAQTPYGVLRFFQELPDPRWHNHRHKLADMLALALFAIICGAGDWVAVVFYAKAKEAWFKTFLELPNGIPSHDTFNRVFSRLNPEALERCFQAWMASVVELGGGKLVAIDGKSLRRSFAHGWDKCGMAHMVSAFVAANRMVFAQVNTPGKGHELDGIKQLLGLMDLHGAVVTIDAIGCNKEIAELLVQAKADYVLQVKDNQPTLLAKIQTLMQEAVLEGFKGFCSDTHQTIDGDHGRIETRQITVLWDVKHLGPIAQEWPGLKSIAMVQRTRELAGQKSTETSYYIATLDRRRKAATFLSYTRGHWSVENNLHWQLDVSFNEDQRRLRTGHGAENFSRFCRIALNLLKAEKTRKAGINNKRLSCGWDNDYLLKVFAG